MKTMLALFFFFTINKYKRKLKKRQRMIEEFKKRVGVILTTARKKVLWTIH